MPVGTLVGVGFVRIDADTSPAMKAVQGLGRIGAHALASAFVPASAAAVAGIASVASAAAAAGGAFAVYGAAVGEQFKQVAEASQKQTAAEDAQTKATDAKTIAQRLAKEGGFKYGQQVKITSDMTDAARQRAQNYNAALSQATSSTRAAKLAQQSYKTELAGMPKPTAQFAEALQNLKSDVKSWSDSLAGSTMPIFTKGVQFLSGLLPKLSPIVRDVAAQVEAFAGTLGEGTAGKVFREFGANVKTNGAGALRTFLDVGRNLIVGITGILNAFMPMSAGVTGGLESMTEKFAEWGASLGSSDGFARFTEIAQETGPKLVELLKVLGGAFLDVASAAGPMSGLGIQVLTVFAQLVDAIPTPVLQMLVPAIIAVNTGMKLYAIYQSVATAATWLFATSVTTSSGIVASSRVVLLLFRIQMAAMAVVTGVTTAATWAWSAAMTVARVGMVAFRLALTAVRVAVLFTAGAMRVLALAMLTNPVGIIITALVALGAVFYLAWKKSETFRNIVKGALSGVADVGRAVGGWFAGPFAGFFTTTIPNAFRALLSWVASNWPWILGALTGPVGLAVVWIIKNWDKVKAGASALRDKVVGAWNGLRDGLAAAFGAVRSRVLAPIGNYFTRTLPANVRNMRDTVVGAWTGLRDRLAGAYSSIRSRVLAPIGNYFTRTLPTSVRNMRDTVVGAWAGLRDRLAGVYSSIRSRVFSPIGNYFTRTIPGWARTLRDKVKGFFGDMRDGIGTIWNGIKKKTKTPVNWVLDHVWNRGLVSIWGKIAGWVGLDNKLKPVKLLASGGTVGRAEPGVFNKPTAIVGEGNPRYPEYVIPTDPKYATRARGLWQAAGAHFYADGGILGTIGGAISSAAGKAIDFGKGAVDFLSNPVGKAKDLLTGPLKRIKEAIGTSSWARMAARLPRMAVDGLIKAIKSVGSDLLGLGGGGPEPKGSGVQRWRGTVQQALKQVGQPLSLTATTLRRMNQESGGNPRIVNKWDSNWQAGYPSVGLMQVIRPTFQSHAGKYRKTGPFLYGVSTNGLANIYASMKYAMAAYGSLSRAYNRPGGYALGTDGATSGWHWTGETGPELMKLPAGTKIRSHRASVRQAAATAAAGTVHLTVENHGIIGSQQETLNWLVAALDQLDRRNRLPRGLRGTA